MLIMNLHVQPQAGTQAHNCILSDSQIIRHVEVRIRTMASALAVDSYEARIRRGIITFR